MEAGRRERQMTAMGKRRRAMGVSPEGNRERDRKAERSMGWAGAGERASAHEALPHTPPGGKPPETPAPFPWECDCRERRSSSQGFAAPAKSAALDRSIAPPEEAPQIRERGPWGTGNGTPRRSAPKRASKFGDRKYCLTNTGLLMEDAETPRKRREKGPLFRRFPRLFGGDLKTGICRGNTRIDCDLQQDLF